MATTPAKGGGNILTRKFGPLPGWAWAAVGVAGYMVYKQRKAASAAAASAPPATTSTAAVSPGAQAPSGYGYQGPGAGGGAGGGPGWNVGQPTGATGGTAGGGVTGSSGGNPGTFYPTALSYAQVNASGLANQAYYYDPANPGLFLPVTYGVASQGLASKDSLALGPAWQ